MTEVPKIRTRLAKAGYSENYFRSYLLHQELGSERYWSHISLALGSELRDDRDARVLDLLANVSTVCDPRIWPLKVVRILTSYGRALPALSAGLLFMHDSMIGPWMIGDVARMQIAIGEEAGSTEPVAVRRVIERWLEKGRHLMGFGVPARPVDERHEYLLERYPEVGDSDGFYWKLAAEIEECVTDLKGLRPNVASRMAAISLDLGFEPAQIRLLTVAFSLASYLGNAYEGYTEPAESLKRLPDDVVVYEGPQDRLSPRAEKAGEERSASE